MESKDPAAQLEDLDRLRSKTRREAGRTPRSAWPVMVIAVVVFFGSNAVIGSDRGRLAASGIWTLFVVLWAAWLHYGRRARLGRPSRTRQELGREALEWVALFALCNAIVVVLGRVSWALVGVALAAIASGWGVVRGRRLGRR